MMNRRFCGMFGFGAARRALPAAALALCLAALWPGAAQGGNKATILNKAVIDSATDDGGGRIRVAWSWGPIPPVHSASSIPPVSLCVFWGEPSPSLSDKTCFTDELATGADLVFDTGLEKGKSVVFEVVLRTNYSHAGIFSLPRSTVTVKN